ncbi:MAG: hypothetical protein RLZZ324_1199 [Candidatus Parcubacteria bacterium]
MAQNPYVIRIPRLGAVTGHPDRGDVTLSFGEGALKDETPQPSMSAETFEQLYLHASMTGGQNGDVVIIHGKIKTRLHGDAMQNIVVEKDDYVGIRKQVVIRGRPFGLKLTSHVFFEEDDGEPLNDDESCAETYINVTVFHDATRTENVRLEDADCQAFIMAVVRMRQRLARTSADKRETEPVTETLQPVPLAAESPQSVPQAAE